MCMHWLIACLEDVSWKLPYPSCFTVNLEGCFSSIDFGCRLWFIMFDDAVSSCCGWSCRMWTVYFNHAELRGLWEGLVLHDGASLKIDGES